MRFRSGELEFNVEVRQRDERLSASSGRALLVLTISFRASSPEIHARALAVVEQGQSVGLFSLDEAHGSEQEWQVLESTTSYVGNEPWGVHHHTWLVQEVERLHCDRLLIGTIELVPRSYREEVLSDGRVHLVALSRVSEPDLRQLSEWHDARTALDVTRVGISPEPRPMLLEDYAWADEGGPRIRVSCVDAAAPGAPPAVGGAVGGVAASTATGGDADLVAELLAVLREKGLLTGAESQRVLEQGRERAWQRRHALRRVDRAADLEGE